MTGTEIRAARPEDARDIVAVAERGWNAAYADILSGETITAALDEWYDPASIRDAIERDDVGYFVADDAGGIVGFASVGPGARENSATLGAIYVDPDEWRSGFGTELLAEVESFCRRREYDLMEFRVLAENDVGLSFYRNHGYEPVDEDVTDLFGESVREHVFRGRIE